MTTTQHYTAKHYQEKLDSIVQRLHRLADDIAREGQVRENALGAPAFSYSAQSVLHELHWGVANLHVDQLINDAAAADAAVREVPPMSDM